MGTVDDYLAGLDEADAAAIGHVYAIARELAPDAEQGLGYGMPALTWRGKPLVSVMRAKKHIGLYPFSGTVVATVAADLAGLPGVTSEKGTIRFQPSDPLPDGVLRDLLSARLAQIAG
ncbi:MAG TPA: hypothetical protein DHV14_12350 [Micrococcales bacterium]|uniref:DUF1801 domain-containing protein n=1 Tax=Miniimonas arenae TaxID=676201 RepID=A0A5C5BA59_9MICO|nr:MULTISPECIES: DUF1801 domain-containing protein [Miniimonas]TNU72875.1 DUF1801 domain-containing protein [Miniimonas arenae]HCX85899.1 hypothetical protein [Micrococcales bacterium]